MMKFSYYTLIIWYTGESRGDAISASYRVRRYEFYHENLVVITSAYY